MNPLRSLFAALLLAAPRLQAGPGDDKTVLCFVSHKTSHGFGAHEYAAGCRLIGKWLEESYPDAKIESRYSINWPTDPDTFFKDADTVIFFCGGGGGGGCLRVTEIFCTSGLVGGFISGLFCI
jgi:hypothetical protein